MENTSSEFCKDPFWDLDTIWYTSNPRFTECFHQTVLTWIPVLILAVFSPLEFLSFGNYRSLSSSPSTRLTSSKMTVTSALLLFTVMDAVFIQDYDRIADYTEVIAFSFAYSYSLFLQILTQKTISDPSGKFPIAPSKLQFSFFVSVTICHVLDVKRHYDNPYFWIPVFRSIFAFTAIILYSVSYTINRMENTCPKRYSSVFSNIWYAWSTPLLWKGYRNPLIEDDLWTLDTELTSKTIRDDFESVYFKSSSSSTTIPPRKYGILNPLCRCFGWEFAKAFIYKILADTLTILAPQIMKLMILFSTSYADIKSDDDDISSSSSSSEEETWKGYFYASLLLTSSILQSIALSQYFETMYVAGIKVRTALTGLVYKKSLKLSNASRTTKSVGEIVNVMSVDISRIVDIFPYLNMLWSSPVQICVSIYFIYLEIGISIFAGAGILLATIPINVLMGSVAKRFQMKLMTLKDHRVKLVSELLSGIKILKLYAWEPFYERKVEAIRDDEVRVLKKTAWITAFMGFVWSSAPFFVALASFTVYVFFTDDVLTAERAFVTLSYVNSIRMPLAIFPHMIVSIISARVSTQRINEFLNCEELQEDASVIIRDDDDDDDDDKVDKDKDKVDKDKVDDDGYAVIVEDANFRWNHDESNTLNGISLKIKRGKLTAIVGSVGSGKSSLLSGLLGEMIKTSGTVKIKGSVAYVPQEAWMQNATLKNNILFGKSYDPIRYRSVIQNCALDQDLAILPAGDETEIGEKGINLSGGQKQRISVARALYNRADIHLMDDPLSAVDAHVARHIFSSVLSNTTGSLKDKTRILVTHTVFALPYVDEIVVMKDGNIVEIGTYDELAEKNIIQTITTNVESFSAEKPFSPDIPEKQRPTTEIISKIIEKESVETGSIGYHVYKYYVSNVGFVGTLIILLSQTGYQISSLGTNVWLEAWSGNSLGNSTIESNRNMYLAVYGALGFCQSLFIFALSSTLALYTLRASKSIHNEAYSRVLRAPMSFFETTPLGRILNRFAKDISVCDSLLPQLIRQWLSVLFNVIGISILIVSMIPYFIVISVATAVVFILIQKIYIASSRQLKRLESISRSPIYSHFSESLTGLSTIRAFNAQRRFIRESDTKIDNSQRCSYPSIIMNRWLAMRLETIGNLSTFAVAVFTVLEPEIIGPSRVGLVLSYSLMFTQVLNWLLRTTSEIETNIVAVERLKEYTELEREREWRSNRFNSKQQQQQRWKVETGSIRFENYSLRYRSNLDPVLRNLNFEIIGGQKIGIVGRTGAGKSSLTVALFRLVEPYNGRILIDDIDISTLGLHDLREILTIIPQEPTLFGGTLRSNLDPGSEYTDHDVWTSLDRANLKQFVSNLDGNLYYRVSEGGMNLSAGQRQLFCLARALLRNSKILILDEATASVDLETDDKIQRTIRNSFANCTVLTIAHRLTTIMDYDKIIVMERGTIKEYGAPYDLVRNHNSEFYAMILKAGINVEQL